MKTNDQQASPKEAVSARVDGHASTVGIDDRRPSFRQHYHLMQLMRTHSNAIGGSAIALAGSVVQRASVGMNAPDHDRANIQVEDLNPLVNPPVRFQANGRLADGSFRLAVQQVNANTGLRLRHYMVTKTGALYQFPIRHVFEPQQTVASFPAYEANSRVYRRDQNAGGGGLRGRGGGLRGRGGWRGGGGGLAPNWQDVAVAGAHERGGQVEPFGGVQVVNPQGNNVVGNNNPNAQNNPNDLYASRDATLRAEYAEENRGAVVPAGNLNVVRSQMYASGFGAGTISVVDSPVPLVAGHNANALANDNNRGNLEMAGTVVIDCADLVAGVLAHDGVEDAIALKLQNARDAFYQAHAGTHDPTNARQQGDMFAHQGGILGHLVGLVAEDIIAQRAAVVVAPVVPAVPANVMAAAAPVHVPQPGAPGPAPAPGGNAGAAAGGAQVLTFKNLLIATGVLALAGIAAWARSTFFS